MMFDQVCGLVRGLPPPPSTECLRLVSVWGSGLCRSQPESQTSNIMGPLVLLVLSPLVSRGVSTEYWVVTSVWL